MTRGFHGNVGDAFGFFDGAANGTDRGIEIDDQAFAQAFGFRRAQCQKLHLLFVDFRDQRARFCAADIQPDHIFVFLAQICAPAFDSTLRSFATATPALESGFKITCREYCRSMDCTRPALACHCEKFSASMRYLPEKSPPPK